MMIINWIYTKSIDKYGDKSYKTYNVDTEISF